MKLNIKDLKNGRQWQSSTGLSEEKFYNLLNTFKMCYEKQNNNQSLSEGLSNLGIKNSILSTYEDCLFFVLFQLKNGLTFDVLGLIFNTDGSNAKRNFERYLVILELALAERGYVPKRSFSDEKEFLAYLKDEKELIFDGTEFPIERPDDREEQKEAFSGKKKHT